MKKYDFQVGDRVRVVKSWVDLPNLPRVGDSATITSVKGLTHRPRAALRWDKPFRYSDSDLFDLHPWFVPEEGPW